MQLEKLEPIGDIIIVRPIKDTETPGGIFVFHGELPRGEVLSVGPGFYGPNGQRCPPSVKKGDVVLFRDERRGIMKRIGGEEVRFMVERDFLTVIRE